MILVCDNLNTHNITSLYEAVESTEALRLAKRIEIHHTPKHGNWLNIAEIELFALGNLYLSKRRTGDIDKLKKELKAWNTERLKHLYPILNF